MKSPQGQHRGINPHIGKSEWFKEKKNNYLQQRREKIQVVQTLVKARDLDLPLALVLMRRNEWKKIVEPSQMNKESQLMRERKLGLTLRKRWTQKERPKWKITLIKNSYFQTLIPIWTRQYLSSQHDTEQESCQEDEPLPSNNLRRKLQRGTQFPHPVPARGPDSESNWNFPPDIHNFPFSGLEFFPSWTFHFSTDGNFKLLKITCT